MKCIRCGNDSKYKDRTDRTCLHCRRKFAFEPKAGDPVTDALFESAIKSISGGGGASSVRWGVEHLYYEICRRKKVRVAPLVFIYFILAVTAFFLALAAFQSGKAATMLGFVGLVGFVLSLVAIGSRVRGPFVRIDLETFNRLWDRWKAVHGTPAGVIQRSPEVELPKDLESDIGDYSFDRAVICDRARTVDLLVANNFHFENNCAILTMKGYPKGPFEIIKKMLKRNPKLQIFVLHDATPEGCQLAHRLVTDPDWFGGSGLRVIDLGLRPRHAGPFRGLLIWPQDGLVDPVEGIRTDEAEWLTRHRLQLAAARPEQVLKRLFAGLQAHANDDPRKPDTSPQGSDGGMVTSCGAFDSGGYGGADGSESGADAFG